MSAFDDRGAFVVMLRCFAELNDYLPQAMRQRENAVSLRLPMTIADLIEAQGIPRAEIELVLVNGHTCAVDTQLHDGDRVSLYPVFEAMDVSPLLRLRRHPLRRVRFVADAHLGRLARYLRLLGFDTLFENDPGDAVLAEISATQSRILLTRDHALLARRLITHGLRVPPIRPRAQVVWLVERLDLNRLFRPFTRCMVCNGCLNAIDKSRIQGLVPARVLGVFRQFWRCESCARIYWRGSHYERLRTFVDGLGITPLAVDGVESDRRDGLS